MEGLALRGVVAEQTVSKGKGEEELAVETRDGIREKHNRRAQVTVVLKRKT